MSRVPCVRCASGGRGRAAGILALVAAVTLAGSASARAERPRDEPPPEFLAIDLAELADGSPGSAAAGHAADAAEGAVPLRIDWRGEGPPPPSIVLEQLHAIAAEGSAAGVSSLTRRVIRWPKDQPSLHLRVRAGEWVVAGELGSGVSPRRFLARPADDTAGSRREAPVIVVLTRMAAAPLDNGPGPAVGLGADALGRRGGGAPDPAQLGLAAGFGVTGLALASVGGFVLPRGASDRYRRYREGERELAAVIVRDFRRQTLSAGLLGGGLGAAVGGLTVGLGVDTRGLAIEAGVGGLVAGGGLALGLLSERCMAAEVAMSPVAVGPTFDTCRRSHLAGVALIGGGVGLLSAAAGGLVLRLLRDRRGARPRRGDGERAALPRVAVGVAPGGGGLFLRGRL